MSRFIPNIREFVVKEFEFNMGYIIYVDIYANIRDLTGAYRSGYNRTYSYRSVKVGYAIKYLDKNGNLHRNNDKPAYKRFNNNNILQEEKWYKHGILHRDNKDNISGETLPAVINIYGTKIWYINGVITRDDDSEPAYIYREVEKRWYKNGNFSHNEGNYISPDITSKNGDLITTCRVNIDLPQIYHIYK